MTIITDDRGGYYPPPRNGYYCPRQPSDPKSTGIAFMVFGGLFFIVGALVYKNAAAKKKATS